MTIVVHSFDVVLALVCLYCCVKFLGNIKIIGGVDDSNIALDVGLQLQQIHLFSSSRLVTKASLSQRSSKL